MVIGDSSTLQHDPHWKAFVDWCREEGCYVHKDFKGEQLEVLYAAPKKKTAPRVYRAIGSGAEVPRESFAKRDKDTGAGMVEKEDTDDDQEEVAEGAV